MEHIRRTKAGFTHWSSGPGNLTFDPDCPACWDAELLKTQNLLRHLVRQARDVLELLVNTNDGYRQGLISVIEFGSLTDDAVSMARDVLKVLDAAGIASTEEAEVE